MWRLRFTALQSRSVVKTNILLYSETVVLCYPFAIESRIFRCFVLVVVIVSTGFLRVITFANCRTVFQKYCLELMNTTLSQCFIKQSTVEAYDTVDVYLNALSTTALVAVVLLSSTLNRYLPTERTTGSTESDAWPESQNGRIGHEEVLLHN